MANISTVKKLKSINLSLQIGIQFPKSDFHNKTEFHNLCLLNMKILTRNKFRQSRI